MKARRGLWRYLGRTCSCEGGIRANLCPGPALWQPNWLSTSYISIQDGLSSHPPLLLSENITKKSYKNELRKRKTTQSWISCRDFIVFIELRKMNKLWGFSICHPLDESPEIPEFQLTLSRKENVWNKKENVWDMVWLEKSEQFKTWIIEKQIA